MVVTGATINAPKQIEPKDPTRVSNPLLIPFTGSD